MYCSGEEVRSSGLRRGETTTTRWMAASSRMRSTALGRNDGKPLPPTAPAALPVAPTSADVVTLTRALDGAADGGSGSEEEVRSSGIGRVSRLLARSCVREEVSR